jgi:hypothetical protein
MLGKLLAIPSRRSAPDIAALIPVLAAVFVLQRPHRARADDGRREG